MLCKDFWMEIERWFQVSGIWSWRIGWRSLRAEKYWINQLSRVVFKPLMTLLLRR